jgi:hypothetical protein
MELLNKGKESRLGIQIEITNFSSDYEKKSSRGIYMLVLKKDVVRPGVNTQTKIEHHSRLGVEIQSTDRSQQLLFFHQGWVG